MNRAYEEIAVVAQMLPVDVNGASGTLGPIDMSPFDELLIYLQLGVAAASAKATVTVTDCPTSGGSYNNTPGKQMLSTASVGGETLVMNVPAASLNSGSRFVEIGYVGAAHSLIAAVLVVGRGNGLPATPNQIVGAVNTVIS